MHINVSVKCDEVAQPLPGIIAGILAHIRDMTLFMNPCEESYRRLGHNKAPLYVTWSAENRSQLIRIPAAVGAGLSCALPIQWQIRTLPMRS